MKHKIGVMGSSKLPNDKKIQEKAKDVGRHIARHNCVLVNGATTRMPYMAALGAQEESGFVMGKGASLLFYGILFYAMAAYAPRKGCIPKLRRVETER